jgi:hypothetical protein
VLGVAGVAVGDRAVDLVDVGLAGPAGAVRSGAVWSATPVSASVAVDVLADAVFEAGQL